MRLCKALNKYFDFVKMMYVNNTNCIEKYKEENKNYPKSYHPEIIIMDNVNYSGY